MTQSGVKLTLLVLLACAVFFGGGCATNRSIVDVQTAPGANPPGGKAVKILNVTDGRKFETAPRVQSIPSLNEEEINDSSVRSRAIGRKRNSFGKALGDFLLPENRTVQIVIKEAMTKALREKGYSVVEEGSAEYEAAAPLRATIKQFWAYITIGFWALTLEFETIATVQGDVFPTQKEEEIRGYGDMSAQTGMESNWIEVMQKGIDDFISKFKERLRSPTGN